MDVLSSELGMSKKTLYGIFRDKDDLIESVVNQDLEENRQKLAVIREQQLDPLSEFLEIYHWTRLMREAFSAVFFFDLKRYYPQTFLHWTYSRRDTLLEAIRANLARGIAQGLYRSEIDAEVVAQLHVARIQMLETGDLIPAQLSHSPVFLEQVLRYHLHGICSRSGQEALPAHFDTYYKYTG